MFIVILVISLIIFTVIILVLPPFIKEFNEILIDLPNGLSKINSLLNTNLNKLNVGDSVNLEADALIKYVEKLLLFNKNSKEDFSSNNISSEWLKENGW